MLLVKTNQGKQNRFHDSRTSAATGSVYNPVFRNTETMLFCISEKGTDKAEGLAMKIRLNPGFTYGSKAEKQALRRLLARLRVTLFPIFLDTEKPTWTFPFLFRAVTKTKLPPPT